MSRHQEVTVSEHELSAVLSALSRVVDESTPDDGHVTLLSPEDPSVVVEMCVGSVNVKLELSRLPPGRPTILNHVHPMVRVDNPSDVDAYVFVTRFGSGGVFVPHSTSAPVPISGSANQFVVVTVRDPEYDVHAFATTGAGGGHLVPSHGHWYTDV
jgi:hypothetical protein